MAEMTNIPDGSGMKPDAETPPSEPKAPVSERTTKKEQRPVAKNGKNASSPNGKRPGPNRNIPRIPQNRPGSSGGNDTNLTHIFRTLLLWAIMFIGVAGLFFLFKGNGEATETEVSNTYYQQLLADSKFQSGKIEQYGLNQYRFHGTFKQSQYLHEPSWPASKQAVQSN